MNIIKLISKKNCYIGQNRQAYIVIHETDNWCKGGRCQSPCQCNEEWQSGWYRALLCRFKIRISDVGPQRRGLGSRGRKRKVWNHEPEFYQYRDLCEPGNRLLYGGRQDRTAGGSFAEAVRMGNRPAEKTLRCVQETLPEKING